MLLALLSLPAAAQPPTLEAHALLQTWLTAWDQDEDPQADPVSYGDPEHDVGFTLQRARFGLGGFLPSPASLEHVTLSWDITAGTDAPFDGLSAPDETLSLESAVVGIHARSGRYGSVTRVGLQRVFFGRDNAIPSADLVFQDRTIGTEWMLPTTSMGLTTAPSLRLGSGDDSSWFAVKLGAFNATESLFDNAGGGMLAVARLEYGLGEVNQTWSADGESALGVGSSVAFHDIVATEAFLWDVDLLGRCKWVTLAGGMARSTVSPADTQFASPTVPAETEQMAVWGQLSGFVPIEGAQGVEIAARWDSFDDAGHREDNGDVARITAGATWRDAVPLFDVGAGYVHREELNGVALKNDTVRVWVQVRPKIDIVSGD